MQTFFFKYKNRFLPHFLPPQLIIILPPFPILIPHRSVAPYRPLFYHECKFIWVSRWWHPLSIQLSELGEQREVIRLILITRIDKITITDTFSPLQRPTHASIRPDVDKQYFNGVSSEEVVMNVAGICRRPEWMAFLPLLHADAYALRSFDCNANGTMATVNQCWGVEISIFKWK